MEPYVKIEVPGPPRGEERRGTTIRSKFSTRALGGMQVVSRQQFIKSYVPAKTAKYRDHIGTQANLAMRGKAVLQCAVKLEILAIYPIPPSWSKAKQAAALTGTVRPTGKPDWDNIGKVVSDALTRIVWQDDAPVVEGRVQKFYGERPFVHIEVFI